MSIANPFILIFYYFGCHCCLSIAHAASRGNCHHILMLGFFCCRILFSCKTNHYFNITLIVCVKCLQPVLVMKSEHLEIFACGLPLIANAKHVTFYHQQQSSSTSHVCMPATWHCNFVNLVRYDNSAWL